MPIKDRDRRNAYMREYYAKNAKIQIERVRARRERENAALRHLIEETKDVPCTDCGVRYPTYVLDFDHVRGKKMFNIGEVLRHGVPLRKLQQEIDKCEVVCANCHRIRSYSRLQETIREGKKPDPDDLTLW